MSFPSITLLFAILKTMIWTGAQCIILGRQCATFEVTKGSLNTWFTALKVWVSEKAKAITEGLIAGLWWWVDWLYNKAVGAYDKAVSAVNWISNTGSKVYSWYNWLKDRLTQLATTWYNRLVSLARDWYNRLVSLANDWYWWIKAVCIDSGNALVNLVQNWYWQIHALVNTWYNRLIVLARDWFAWLQAFISDPWGTIRAYISTIWDWLVAFWSNPLKVLAAILGAPWQFLLSLFGLDRNAILAFIRDTLKFWYDIWSRYRQILLALLDHPAETILAAIRDVFLDWVEDLIAENW